MKRILLSFPETLSRFCLLAACLVLLGGCSSIKVVETWNNPSRSAPHYQKLMILGASLDENVREMAENIIVDELGNGGVRAIASHTVMKKDIEHAKRDDVIAAVRSSGADAVLSIRPISKGDTTVTQSGQSGSVYGTATNVGGSYLPSAKSYSLASMQTNLYDSATTELIWSATITTHDAERQARVSRDLARFLLVKLRKDGLL